MATNTTSVFAVGGMGCGMCVERVRRAVAALPGVVEVEVRLKDADMTVSYDSAAVSPVDIASAVDTAGYSCKLK